MKKFLFYLNSLFLTIFCMTLYSQTSKPNIVFILVDDQGYGDLGCFGSKVIATPNIDRLCSEGMKFTSFYVHNRCSPTRMAFMTGSHTHRAGTENVIYRREGIGIHENEITIAEKMREAGYTTGIVGKWHLGEHEQFNPIHHGFDSFYGFQVVNDKPTTALLKNDKVIEMGVKKTDGINTPKLLSAGIEFIKNNKDNPFFLFYSSPLPHTKWVPLERFAGSSKQGIYGDVNQEIDWQVGELMKALDEHKLTENTLVIYTSDNGPRQNIEGRGSAGPLRDGKGSNFEGGIRVPCIMRWPAVIPSGTVNHEITGIIDMLPTFCNLAGTNIPTDRVVDGRDLSPYLFRTNEGNTIHDSFIVPGKTIRYKNWKLFYGRKKAEQPYDKFKLLDREKEVYPEALYHLKNDIGETENIIKDHPEIVQELSKMMTDFMNDLHANTRKIGKVEGFVPYQNNKKKNNSSSKGRP